MSVRKEVSSTDMQLTGIQCLENSLKGKKRKSESGSFHQKNERPTEIEERKSKSKSSDGRSDKLASKHVNECSQDVCAPKDDYIHVRAKRGQATKSHSLAERVRREKISERMRLLQDLVPGCNKITGKALMLDEIINYVQSLQRQVEFLSMKLAAVNPELNFDIEQIVTKDMLHSRDGSLAAFEYPLGMNILHPHFHGSSSHGISDIPNSADVLGSNIMQLPSEWDNELHNILQMGFIPNPPPLAGSDPNGSMEMEL